MDRRLRQQVLRRKKRWSEELLPLIRAHGVRPNAAFLSQPHVAALLQHLSDALAELLMTRPLAPFPWLADYLRHACKLSYQIEHDATSLLMLEMHKKRRVIENTLRDTKSDEVSSKQLIRSILSLEQELELPEDERRLLSDDLEFLVTEVPSRQEHWSVDTTTFAFPSNAIDAESQEGETESDAAGDVVARQHTWLQEFLFPQRDLDSYHFSVMEGVIRALVHLQLAAPSSRDASAWLVAFLRGEDAPQAVAADDFDDVLSNVAARKPHASSSSPPTMSLFFKTNVELMRKIELLKHAQREMHARMERLQASHQQLESELAMRSQFILKLSESRVTTRTHAIMDGTPVFLDSQKHWVLPGCLLAPSELSDDELLGLRRAECFLMQKDETRWRFLLLTQKRHDASVRIQSCWRCARDSRGYRELLQRRRRAAAVIQRNYFHHLFHRAVCLPSWCVVGREVLVAPSVALKCAISFQFYPKKDFPSGNYKRIPIVADGDSGNGSGGMTLAEMKELCRQEEECAGFSTDGSMKRFLPRKLSQLKDMAEPTHGDPEDGESPTLTMQDGLYVKVFPSKSDKVVNTGVIVAIPDDRFGLVQVCFDGTAVVESVPLAKLSDRWKRMRIRLQQKREKKKAKRTFVFGKVAETDEEEDEVAGGETEGAGDNNSGSNSSSAKPAFEKLDGDCDDDFDEEEAKRRRRHRRLRQKRLAAAQAQVQVQTDSQQPPASRNNDLLDSDEDELIEFLYEDQATKRVVRKEPKRTFSDPETLANVVAQRKRDYEQEQAAKFERKKLASVVRLQCAWRSKRARDAFRQVIQLRAKEKEREKLVQRAHATHAASSSPSKKKTQASSSKKTFFSKLFRT